MKETTFELKNGNELLINEDGSWQVKVNVSHPLEEGEFERLHKICEPMIEEMKSRYPKEVNIEGFEPALTSDIIEIVSQTLAQERKKWEKETIGNWAEKVKPEQLIFSDIEKARQEERAKVVKECCDTCKSKLSLRDEKQS